MNKRVFDVCTEKYIGELAGQDILSLLKINDESNIDNHFNAIRKIIEDTFVAFNKFGLLPQEFVTPNVSLNEASKFLAGIGADGVFFTEKGFQHLEETHLPKQIASNIRSILSTTQAGSHRSEIDSFVNTVRTPFLFKSVLYQLFDVLVWFKMYIETKPQIENWIKPNEVEDLEQNDNSISGTIINIHPKKGFAFLRQNTAGENIFIPPHLVNNFSLSVGQEVIVEVEEYIDNRSNDLKIRVCRIVE